MKKKIYLIITLIISFCFFTCKTYAKEEVTYKNNLNNISKNNVLVLNTYNELSNRMFVVAKKTSSNKKSTGNTCEDLFDKDLIEFIDDIMKTIRIVAPILLIIFGITDFLMATFSGDEKKMVEKRDKFLKRILAAVLLFLVPTFVRLFLEMGNSVWSWINPETCIK